jgi:hypothetical protein
VEHVLYRMRAKSWRYQIRRLLRLVYGVICPRESEELTLGAEKLPSVYLML